MEITGKVKEIFQGEIASGRNQGDAFYSVTLEENPDEKLTAFKAEYIEGLEQGKEYTFTVEKKGKYINITGETVPCIDQGGDMREEVEYEEREEVGSEKDGYPVGKVKVPIRKVAGKPVKIVKKRKPPVVTSTMGDERKYKNRISALNSAVDYFTAVYGGTASDDDLMEYADKFLAWIEK